MPGWRRSSRRRSGWWKSAHARGGPPRGSTTASRRPCRHHAQPPGQSGRKEGTPPSRGALFSNCSGTTAVGAEEHRHHPSASAVSVSSPIGGRSRSRLCHPRRGKRASSLHCSHVLLADYVERCTEGQAVDKHCAPVFVYQNWCSCWRSAARMVLYLCRRCLWRVPPREGVPGTEGGTDGVRWSGGDAGAYEECGGQAPLRR
mmetsp:Transcript_3879/g.12311  ORF Transcript_3879/g.12311 Transcript_3879/m.12311 type:complete len:202 (+) Transcript_3879:1304-1909(+)